jgi:hypothetical protein
MKQRSGETVTPLDAIDPSESHRTAVYHYLECRAVNQFPDDGWVRRTAMILHPVFMQREQKPILELTGIMRQFMRALND